MVQRLPDIAPAAAASSAPAECHEDIFLARYAAMRGWALRLAEGDRARAEDLVHDAYVHFTLARPPLREVENLDGYLFVMLRNLHTSQARRAARLRERMLPAIDYDSASGAARAADPRDLARVHDELRACCRYACARMHTSKAGSVLALRFFHGYYPREIARVVRATRESVEERLRAARGEARQFLKDPSALRFMRDDAARAGELRFAREGAAVLTTDELLTDLRRAIFDSREGDCPAAAQLEGLYGAESASVDTRTLAHVVCCPCCIDEVNRLLGLPPLAGRFPVDMTERDERPRRKGGGGDGGDGDDGGDGPRPTSGGASEEDVLRCRERARDAFEHRPQELCVAVNGRVLATQSAGASRCEQTLALPLAEGVEFIEVFSEQEVRLLFIDVNEHLAGARQSLSASVALSDERTLAATLSFGDAWPTVQVVYEDPLLHAAAQANAANESARANDATHSPRVAGASDDSGARVMGEAAASIRPPRALKISEWLTKVSARLTGAGFRLRPAALTAALAIVVVAALLLTRVSTPTASAAELLDRSAAAEDKLATDAALVLHRTYFVEESPAAAGAAVTRLRVEVWQSAARALKLRRVLDRENRLVAGAWEREGGARRTVYRRGAGPAESAAAPDALTLLEAGEAWGLDLSARTFSALVGDDTGGVTVEEALGSYVLTYRGGADGNDSDGGGRSLLSATLRLSKSDLRATGQTLVVRRGEARREYRFIEGGLERLPAGSVAPGVFQPEPELSGAATAADASVGTSAGQGGAVSSSGGGAPARAVASPELEVEVAYLLNRIKADMGEQITWTRTTGGQLRVEALAETEGRKEEILRALGPVIDNPAVEVDVATVEERVRRERVREGGEESTSEIEVRTGRTAAHEDLRRHFSARLAGDERVEAEIKAFGARAMNRSRAALLHASALKRLVARFTPEQARALRPEAREKWLAMLGGHAQAIRREVRALDGELRLVFPPGNTGGGAGREASNPAASAESLLRLAYGADEAVRSAFTVTAGGASPAAGIKSPQFWRSLRDADRLAASIADAYQK
ncbi:MAG TPA: sigma-70 family RNA polymerase sigma factor [Pyrinomonadaceae bacterium]